MSLVKFYKPNSASTGSAASFQSKENKGQLEVYLNMVKQSSWDISTKTGSFKSDDPSSKIAVKFNAMELAAIAKAIMEKGKFSTVHVYGKDKTSISFAPYTKKDGVTISFGLSVTKNSNKFSISFEQHEAYALKLFCDHSIQQIFAFEK